MAFEMSNKSARITYFGFFVASLFISWILSEFAAPLLEKFPWINNADHSKDWYQINTVYRVSLGNFLFFLVLALRLIGVESESDHRNSWHHGRWIVKMTVWLLLIVLMFFMPNEVILVYGLLSKFGAGLFLLVQFVILLDFTSKLQDACVELDEPKWYMALYMGTAGCFISALALYILLFIWFVPGQDSLYNVLFVGISLCLAFALASKVMINESNEGAPFPATVTFFFCAYVCYTGLASEPSDNIDGVNSKAKSVLIISLILGMTSTILSVLYIACCAGSIKTFLSPSSPREVVTQRILSFGRMISPPNPSSFRLTMDDLEKALFPQSVSYSYTFFHLIFAVASMYSAMLLSLCSSSDCSNLIDVGWISALVKIGAGWMTTFVYILILTLRSLSRPWPYSLIQNPV